MPCHFSKKKKTQLYDGDSFFFFDAFPVSLSNFSAVPSFLPWSAINLSYYCFFKTIVLTSRNWLVVSNNINFFQKKVLLRATKTRLLSISEIQPEKLQIDFKQRFTDIFLACSSTSSGTYFLLSNFFIAVISPPWPIVITLNRLIWKGIPLVLRQKVCQQSHARNTAIEKLEFDLIQSLIFYCSSGRLIYSIWFSLNFLGYTGIVFSWF